MKTKSDKIKVEKITLTNFRAYDTFTFETDADLVILIGPNGAGKTTIFEAITLASAVKSFRTSNLKELIQWEKPFFHVSVTYSASNERHQAGVSYGTHPANGGKSPPERRLFMDSARVQKVASFIGKIPTVVFSPNDMEILDTTPAARRSFLDYTLSFVKSGYLPSLQAYNRLLKMRSEILRSGKADPTYLDSLDKEIAKYGFFIQDARANFCENFEDPFLKYVRLISNENDQWKFIYQPSVRSERSPRSEAEWYHSFILSRAEDMRLKTTRRGVHRDRISISHEKYPSKDIKEFASQGQKRTASLALKMAQYSYTRSQIHLTPIVLIDDVMNELDKNRRSSFLRFLQDIGQAWVTITDTSGLDDFIRESSDKIKVEVHEIGSSP